MIAEEATWCADRHYRGAYHRIDVLLRQLPECDARREVSSACGELRYGADYITVLRRIAEVALDAAEVAPPAVPYVRPGASAADNTLPVPFGRLL
jgi:hypothetical protein